MSEATQFSLAWWAAAVVLLVIVPPGVLPALLYGILTAIVKIYPLPVMYQKSQRQRH